MMAAMSQPGAHPATPGEHALSELGRRARDVRPPDRTAEHQVRRRLGSLVLPLVQFEELADAGVWWAGVRGLRPAPAPQAPHVLVLAGDHGIAVRGVSALRLGWTAIAARELAGPGGPLTRAGLATGATTRVEPVDVAGPAGPTSRPFDTEAALTPAAVDRAAATGAGLAGTLAADHDLLGLSAIGVGSTTTAAVLLASLCGRRPLDVVTRGSGVDDRSWMRKTAAVRDGLRRARLAGVAPASAAGEHLVQLGSIDLAVAVGFLVEAAARQVPVVIDGPEASVAALLAHRLCPSSRHWFLHAVAPGDTLSEAVGRQLAPASLPVAAGGAGLGACLAVAGLRCAVAASGAPDQEEAWERARELSPSDAS